jgi:hypothetical protein
VDVQPALPLFTSVPFLPTSLASYVDPQLARLFQAALAPLPSRILLQPYTLSSQVASAPVTHAAPVSTPRTVVDGVTYALSRPDYDSLASQYAASGALTVVAYNALENARREAAGEAPLKSLFSGLMDSLGFGSSGAGEAGGGTGGGQTSGSGSSGSSSDTGSPSVRDHSGDLVRDTGGWGWGGATNDTDDGDSGNDDGGNDEPVLLDLDGNGIRLTRADLSPVWMDGDGDGLSERTAWAGRGDGVLVYDANGDGRIGGRGEYVLTGWAPGARSDMEALRLAFDSNHDGRFDASDAAWSKFGALVTNADGTTSFRTLAQLGITGIGLNPDNSRTTFADGSTIHGVGLFTRADGSTGIAADASLATIGPASRVTQTRSALTGGATSVETRVFDAGGTLTRREVAVTTADGAGTTISVDADGDGVDDATRIVTRAMTGGQQMKARRSLKVLTKRWRDFRYRSGVRDRNRTSRGRA